MPDTRRKLTIASFSEGREVEKQGAISVLETDMKRVPIYELLEWLNVIIKFILYNLLYKQILVLRCTYF